MSNNDYYQPNVNIAMKIYCKQEALNKVKKELNETNLEISRFSNLVCSDLLLDLNEMSSLYQKHFSLCQRVQELQTMINILNGWQHRNDKSKYDARTIPSSFEIPKNIK